MRILPRGIHWSLELGSLGAAIGIWAGGEYLRVRRKPAHPLEARAQSALNRLDRRARLLLARPDIAHRADVVSDLLAYVGLPVSVLTSLMVGCRHWQTHIIRDAMLIARAVTVTGALNQVVKFIAPRERPYVLEGHYDRRDINGSFFSNHTSSAVALAASASRLAFARSRHSLLVAAPLFTMAGLIGYLRIASDNHYFTDVLAGAGFGGVLGLLLAR